MDPQLIFMVSSPQGIHPGVCQEASLGWGFAEAPSVLLVLPGGSHWLKSPGCCLNHVEAPAAFSWWVEENQQQKSLKSCGKQRIMELFGLEKPFQLLDFPRSPSPPGPH